VIADKLLIYLYENILKINKLTPEEMKTYNESVLELEQFILFTDQAKMEGIEIGEKRGIEIACSQIVHNAANKGISVEDISNITNLSEEQVRSILRNRK
jgi:predicted transposase/invertase (TIGR01784 family)